MSTNFPTGLDDFSNPLPSTPLGGGGNGALTHSALHTNINDAVEAIEASIGITNSNVPTSIQYRLNNHDSRITTLEGGSSNSTLGMWTAMVWG